MRLALAFLFVLGVGPAPGASRPADEALARAARFLWSKQGRDGGWHSGTYGLLRSGQSLTPFVLAALLEVPEDRVPRPAGAVRRAIGFIERHVDKEGALGRSDPDLQDYPNYATALGIQALLAAGTRGKVERMAACLERQQFNEALGWKPADAPYGAWGMGGPLRRPPHPGHVDLAMTRHVLAALHDAGVEGPARVRARTYLDRCQNPDGGFYFSPVVPGANKAGREADRFRSYGTATADGILALLATGLSPSDSRVKSGLDWLLKHHRVDRVPGIPEEIDQEWESGMIFYYRAASARVFRKLPAKGWREPLIKSLVPCQREDGGFLNRNFLMKEDDPLIATTFALIALLCASDATNS